MSAATALGLGLAVVGYSAFVDPRITGLSRQVIARWRGPRRYSVGELDSAAKLGLAMLSQVGLCAAIMIVFRIYPGQLVSDRFHPAMMLYGVLLGVGEAGLASFLCFIVMQAVSRLSPNVAPAGTRDWLTLARGGWMRQFVHTARIVPARYTIAAIIFYIGVEEVIFRGLLITSMRPLGLGWAFGGALAVFVVVQLFPRSSWAGTMFPVVGAFVIGILHGWLFLVVPDIRPLIAAHVVAFAAAAI